MFLPYAHLEMLMKLYAIKIDRAFSTVHITLVTNNNKIWYHLHLFISGVDVAFFLLFALLFYAPEIH